MPLFLGVLIATGAQPLHQRVVQRFPKRETLSAAFLTAVVVTVGLALIGALTLVVLGQLVELAKSVADHYRHGGSAEVLGPRVQELLASVGQGPEELRVQLVGLSESVARNLGGNATHLVGASMGGLLTLVLTAITAYFLLRDGERMSDWLIQLIPLRDDQMRELVRSFREVTRAMLLGTGVTALYEASAAFCGYWAAGVPRPLVWAALTGIASVVPVVGMMMIAAPVCGWLVSTGHTTAGLALGLWCVVGVSGVANYVLRPWLLGSKMRMNDLLAFIALFGGVAAFGMLGMILGPIVAALLVSLVHIYQRDYRPRAARKETQ